MWRFVAIAAFARAELIQVKFTLETQAYRVPVGSRTVGVQKNNEESVMKRVHAWTTTALMVSMLALAPVAWAGGAGSVTATGNAAAGAAVFNDTCVACHGNDGKGIMPGMPDFTNRKGVLSLPTKVLEKRITDGFSDGNAPMAMPPKGNNPKLTQGDIRNVIAYLRNTFEH